MGTDGDHPPTGELHLPPERSSAALARRFVAHALRGADESIIEDAVLLVNELVANALVHAGTPIDVSVRHTPDQVRVEVCDRTDALPRPSIPAPDASGGRGLQLVDRLADGGWGVERLDVGKAVWFALRIANR